jgi:hypothetical protein
MVVTEAKGRADGARRRQINEGGGGGRPPNQVRVWGNSSEGTQTSFSGGRGQWLARWLSATQ